MFLWWLCAIVVLVNLLCGLFMGRVWHRNRFVTPAEPLKFYPGLVMSIFFLVVCVVIIAFNQFSLRLPDWAIHDRDSYPAPVQVAPTQHGTIR